jgi:hypothetical protein
MATFDDDKRKKKKRKKKVNEQPKDKVDPKTGLTITEEKEEKEKTEDAKKLDAYSERKRKEKEEQKITSVTSAKRKGGFETPVEQKTKYSRAGKEISEEEAKTNKKKPMPEVAVKANKTEPNKTEPEKTPTTESTTSIYEGEDEDEGMNSGERIEFEKNEKKKKRKKRVEKIKNDKSKTNVQKYDEVAFLDTDKEVKTKPETEEEQKTKKKKKNKFFNTISSIAEEINDLKGSGKGKAVARVLTKKAKKFVEGLFNAEEIDEDEKGNFMSLIKSALLKEKKEGMFKRGFESGGAQMPKDISTVEYLKPTDYYPQIGRAIGVGTSTGEIIGSRTIYTGAGVVAPMGLYDARRRALAAAVKKGVAAEDGTLQTLDNMVLEYRTQWRDWQDERTQELYKNKDYYTNGKLNDEGRKFRDKTLTVGKDLMDLFERTKEYQNHLISINETGKGSLNAADGLYYTKSDQKKLNDFLAGNLKIDDLLDPDKDILKSIAGIKPYRDLVYDLQDQGYIDNLLKERAADKENIQNGTFKSVDGESPSSFIDKSSGLLTQAYKESVEKDRIENLVKGMIEQGVYSKEQEQQAIDVITNTIGDRETITTKQQQVSGVSRSVTAQRGYYDYFQGTTDGLYKESLPQANSLSSSASNNDIKDVYRKTVGGLVTTTTLLNSDGKETPVTIKALDTEGAAQLPVGIGEVSNKFAVWDITDPSNPSFKQYSAAMIVKQINDGRTFKAWGTETPLAKDWFESYMTIAEAEDADIFAVPAADVNALGYVSGGSVIPLDEDNMAGFKSADNSDKVQIKSLYYKPILDRYMTFEVRDADKNFEVAVKRVMSTGGAYLMPSGPMTIPFNSKTEQINTALANQLTKNLTDKGKFSD